MSFFAALKYFFTHLSLKKAYFVFYVYRSNLYFRPFYSTETKFYTEKFISTAVSIFH